MHRLHGTRRFHTNGGAFVLKWRNGILAWVGLVNNSWVQLRSNTTMMLKIGKQNFFKGTAEKLLQEHIETAARIAR